MNVGTVRRIVVIGCTGSGKTTFCNRLSSITGIPHIELDALNWLPNWTPSPQFVEQVNQILKENNAWIIDGNNEKVRETVWASADTIIWLDYSFLTVIWRLIKRTASRLLYRQELWNGNIERWSVVFSWNSVILWGITMWFRYQTEFPMWFSKFPSLPVIKLGDSVQTERFLSSITQKLINW